MDLRSGLSSSCPKFTNNSTSSTRSSSGSSSGRDRLAKSGLRSNSVKYRGGRSRSCQIRLDHPCDCTCERGWDCVTDLHRNLGLSPDEDERIGKTHEPCCLTMSNGPVLHRMQIPTLLWFKELRTDRHRRAIPPEPPQTNRSLLRSCVSSMQALSVSHFSASEAIPPGGTSLVAGNAFRSRIAAEVQVERRWLVPYFGPTRFTQVTDCLPHCSPRRQHRTATRKCVGGCWWELRNQALHPPPDDYSPPPCLRGAVIGGVKDCLCRFKSHDFRPTLDVKKLRGTIEFADVLHDEHLRPG